MKNRLALTIALTLILILLASCGVSEMIYLDYSPTTVTVNLICDATVQDIYERLGVSSIEYRAVESGLGNWTTTEVDDYKFDFGITKEGTYNVSVRALDDEGDVVYEGFDSVVVESLANPMDMDVVLEPTDKTIYKGVLLLDLDASFDKMDIVAYQTIDDERVEVARLDNASLINIADNSRYIFALEDGIYDIAFKSGGLTYELKDVRFQPGYETKIYGGLRTMKWTMVPVKAVYFKIVKNNGVFSVEKYVPRLKHIEYQWYVDGVLYSEDEAIVFDTNSTKWGIVSLVVRARCRGKTVAGSSYLENI